MLKLGVKFSNMTLFLQKNEFLFESRRRLFFVGGGLRNEKYEFK